jgi:hypothetical protein
MKITEDLLSLREEGLGHLTDEEQFNLFLQKNDISTRNSEMFFFLQEKALKLVKHLGRPKERLLNKKTFSSSDISVINKESFDSWDRYKVSISSFFNHRITLYFTVPKIRSSRSNKIMICLHQSAYGTKEEPMGLTDSDNDYARFFANKGYITVTPDILGFGEELKDYTPIPTNLFKQFLLGKKLLSCGLKYCTSNEKLRQLFRDSSWSLCNVPYRQILKDNPGWTGVGIFGYELQRVVDFIFFQDFFDFDKEKVMVTGLSHGAVNSGFVLPFEQRIREYSSVGGGYYIDTHCKQVGWPAYFGSRFDSFVSEGKWDLDYYEALCLIFPRKMILFNAAGDYGGRLKSEAISVLKKLYSSFKIEHKLTIIMDHSLSLDTNGRPHCYNREVQEIILNEIEKE